MNVNEARQLFADRACERGWKPGPQRRGMVMWQNGDRWGRPAYLRDGAEVTEVRLQLVTPDGYPTEQVSLDEL